jgi:hypothetical protein
LSLNSLVVERIIFVERFAGVFIHDRSIQFPLAFPMTTLLLVSTVESAFIGTRLFAIDVPSRRSNFLYFCFKWVAFIILLFLVI